MSDDTSGTTNKALNGAAVAVVLIVALAIVVVSLFAIAHYQDAKDTGAVLGVILGPLAGLGAAAFGIKLGADAKAETDKVKTDAGRQADALESALAAPASGNEVRGAQGATVDEARIRDVAQNLRRLSR